MTDLSKLTAKDFSDAMHKGWKCREWGRGSFRRNDKGETVFNNADATRVCALGSMCCAFDVMPSAIVDAITRLVPNWHSIAEASDNAGNKRAAMKAVDAILLGEKQ